MSVTAKPVLKDKFWIIEDNGARIGTLSKTDDRYMFSSKVETCYFDNTRQIHKKLGVKLTWPDGVTVSKQPQKVDFEVYGYPTSVQPFNCMFDVKHKLPLFTKSEKSKSLYCAGYYIIRFDKGWVKSFCPKLITVERYETKGPFKTEFEMKQELSRAN